MNKRDTKRWLRSIERARDRVTDARLAVKEAEEDLAEEVRLARAEGLSPEPIADVLGIHRDSVSRMAPLRKNKRRASV